MNKNKAKATLFVVQKSYVSAIKAFGRADGHGRNGKTAKALEERDKAMAYIRKAEGAIAALETMIDE